MEGAGMETPDLRSPAGIRAACERALTSGRARENWQQWVRDLAGSLERVSAADLSQRGTLEFQNFLWKANKVASAGQGLVSVDKALEEAPFREWLARESMRALPSDEEERSRWLSNLGSQIG